MSDHIMNNYAMNDAFHADLIGLSARFVAIQEEIQNSVHQLEDFWKGSAAESHREWQMNFDKLSQEIQQAAHQAFNSMNDQVGSDGAMNQFDIMAASRFGG